MTGFFHVASQTVAPESETSKNSLNLVHFDALQAVQAEGPPGRRKGDRAVPPAVCFGGIGYS
jgi:hypothetical protein